MHTNTNDPRRGRLGLIIDRQQGRDTMTTVDDAWPNALVIKVSRLWPAARGWTRQTIGAKFSSSPSDSICFVNATTPACLCALPMLVS